MLKDGFLQVSQYLSPTETREIAKPGLSLSMINLLFKRQVKITLLLTKINTIWSIWPT